MSTLAQKFVVALLATTASAAFESNLNYNSPSLSHPGLAVEIRKVHARSTAEAAWKPSDLKFTHGVASGDPYEDSVILWTRAAPSDDNDRSNITVSGIAEPFNHETESYVKASKSPVCVEFKVATDSKLKTVVDRGTLYTSSDVDYTIKVEANKLKPFTQYYYQFNICKSDNKSPLGRTKTVPRKKDKLKQNVKIAVFSCSNHPFGFFNAYGNVARKDSVDFVVHLGDYIYEYRNGVYGWGNSLERVPQPDKEIFSLYDYRKRIAQYRTDKDLLLSHQQFPWIPVWDDHEIGDNTFKDGMSSLTNNEESFIKSGGVSVDQRKMNAVRAYFEWMPIRQVDMDDNLRIWRNFEIGNLIDLIMLDTRNYDRSITDLYTNTKYINTIKDDASRSLMGGRQEHWFYNKLTESSKRGAKWRFVGNQIVFARVDWTPVAPSLVQNVDAWDGYTANKNRTLSHLYENKIDNTIFLAGDSHASWVSDLTWLDEKEYDPKTGKGSIGVEFAGSAVSSPSPIGQNVTLTVANGASALLVNKNPEMQWQDFYYRGYYELDVGYENLEAKYFGIPNIRIQNGHEISLANFTVKSGENRLSRKNGGVAGGVAESGSLRGGKVSGSKITFDTATGKFFSPPL